VGLLPWRKEESMLSVQRISEFYSSSPKCTLSLSEVSQMDLINRIVIFSNLGMLGLVIRLGGRFRTSEDQTHGSVL